MKRVKIVDVKRFVTMVIILLGIIIIISFGLSSTTLSHGDPSYKTITVSSGDTLWYIAEEERLYNKYYEGKDVRDIISDLRKINNMASANLEIGQIIEIPYI